MLKKLMERVVSLKSALDNAANNYNALAGRLEEAKFLLEEHRKDIVNAPADVTEEVEQEEQL